MNKAGLTVIAFMTYMVMSGLLTQIGVIISPLANYLDISITQAASMFSLLTGGTFAGTFIAMWLYDRFTTKGILQINYLLLFSLLILLVSLDSRIAWLVSTYFFLLGLCCGVGLAGGAVLIANIYNEQKRASAFLATDCSFSLAGFVFPSLAATLLAANHQWTLSYAAVGVLAFIIVGASFCLQFPPTNKPVSADNLNQQSHPLRLIWTPRVLIIALALCLYLSTQTTFLTWAPQYLQQVFAVDKETAASAVANYWGPSVFGLLSVTLLVMKIPTRPLLIGVLLIAIGLSTLLFTTQNPSFFLTVTLGLGFLTSCIFKLAISIGSQQLNNAPPILVTFLLCSATVGSTLAPAFSAFIVSLFGVGSAMLMTLIGFILVSLLIGICLVLERREVASELAKKAASAA